MIRHESENSRSGYFFRSRIRGNDHLPLSCNAHFHSSFELLYVLEGEFTVHINGTEVPMHPGELALIFPFSIHSFDFDLSKRFRFWIVSFSGNFVNSFLRMMENRSGKEKTFALAGTASSFVKEALFEQEKETAEHLLLVKSALYAVTSLYLEAIPTEEKKASEKLSLAERVLNHVSAHYPEKLTLTSMARSLGYSASYLSHGFGKLFNMSFSSYLNLYRIDQAEILLLNTDLSITEIADQTGFSSIRNFNYVFRSVYGTSPREYRKIKGAVR